MRRKERIDSLEPERAHEERRRVVGEAPVSAKQAPGSLLTDAELGAKGRLGETPLGPESAERPTEGSVLSLGENVGVTPASLRPHDAYYYVRNGRRASRIELDDTNTLVSKRSHNRLVARGKPEAFTKPENAAMRARLKELIDENGWSQQAAGEHLGVGQQAIGTILRGGGFARPTAVALARVCGFDSPELFIAQLTKMPQKDSTPHAPGATWFYRDIAIQHARQEGFPEEVLRRVQERYSEEKENSFHKSPWWTTRIVKINELYEEEVKVPAAAEPVAPAPEAKRRRKAS